MSVRDVPPDESPGGDGSRTAGEGTPFAVDVSRDRRARWPLFMFVSGPVIWSIQRCSTRAQMSICTGNVGKAARIRSTASA